MSTDTFYPAHPLGRGLVDLGPQPPGGRGTAHSGSEARFNPFTALEEQLMSSALGVTDDTRGPLAFGGPMLSALHGEAPVGVLRTPRPLSPIGPPSSAKLALGQSVGGTWGGGNSLEWREGGVPGLAPLGSVDHRHHSDPTQPMPLVEPLSRMNPGDGSGPIGRPRDGPDAVLRATPESTGGRHASPRGPVAVAPEHPLGPDAQPPPQAVFAESGNGKPAPLPIGRGQYQPQPAPLRSLAPEPLPRPLAPTPIYHPHAPMSNPVGTLELYNGTSWAGSAPPGHSHPAFHAALPQHRLQPQPQPNHHPMQHQQRMHGHSYQPPHPLQQSQHHHCSAPQQLQLQPQLMGHPIQPRHPHHGSSPPGPRVQPMGMWGAHPVMHGPQWHAPPTPLSDALPHASELVPGPRRQPAPVAIEAVKPMLPPEAPYLPQNDGVPRVAAINPPQAMNVSLGSIEALAQHLNKSVPPAKPPDPIPVESPMDTAARGQVSLKNRGRGSVEGGRRGTGRAAVPMPHGINVMPVTQPKSLVPDLEILEDFKAHYANQEDEETLKQQISEIALRNTESGGSLDVESCLRCIEQNDVTLVVTDTGTGKSTKVPLALLEANPSNRVVNAQPRRTSAIQLAKYVAELRGETPGPSVGYSVRGEHAGEIGKTQLMYVTNYSLFLYMIWRLPDTIEVTHVILDEFHEQGSEGEFLVLMMKLAISRFPGRFKLILCSATADLQPWQDYFANLRVGVYATADQMYPVHEYYKEDICKMLGLAHNELIPNQAGIVQSLQFHDIRLCIKHLLVLLAGILAPQHGILVFVPGRTFVEELAEWIRANLSDQMDPIPWYRDIDLSSIHNAIDRETVDKKKVFLATNIAEVSLTLRDVVVVIDSGLGKRPSINPHNSSSIAFPTLEMRLITRSNLQQRRGRVGRLQQGFYFSMLSKSQISRLPSMESKISNSVLHELVLHSLQLTSLPYLVFSLCRMEPQPVALQYSLQMLCDGGFIIPESDALSLVELSEDSSAASAAAGAVNASTAPAKDEPGEPSATAAASPYGSGQGSEISPKADHRSDWQQLIVQYAKDHVKTPRPNLSMSYVVTLRGLILSHLPMEIESGSIVLFGFLLGLESLSILAACAATCNSPFVVPYHIDSKVERLKARLQVEELMLRDYHGESNSDIVVVVSAVLAYMRMEREGLSEDAQVEWCTERHLSRTRIVDILNLVVQTKEQLKCILSFSDISDVDELTQQFEKSTSTLSLLCAAAYMHQAFFVLGDAATAAKKGYSSIGIFNNMKCQTDMNVPTSSKWSAGAVCVPFILRTMYDRLLATFTIQLPITTFNLVVLLFAFRVRYVEPVGSDPYIFEVVLQGTPVFLRCDNLTAMQILQVRRIMCAKLSLIHKMCRDDVRPDETEILNAHLTSLRSNFGIPNSIVGRPELISPVIVASMNLIVSRVHAGSVAPVPPDGSAPRQERTAYCDPIAMDRGKFCPTMQSILMHSSDGISSGGSVATRSGSIVTVGESMGAGGAPAEPSPSYSAVLSSSHADASAAFTPVDMPVTNVNRLGAKKDPRLSQRVAAAAKSKEKKPAGAAVAPS